MDVMEAIEGRRSVRRFSKEPLPTELIKQIIEAGRCAPSAGNLQARDFFVVTDQKTKDKLSRAALDQHFIGESSVIIVICSNLKRIEPYGKRGMELYCIQDASAACQNMLLAAHSNGLGSCWIGAFDEAAVSEILGLEPHLRPVALIPIGFPLERPKPRKKRTDDVHWL